MDRHRDFDALLCDIDGVIRYFDHRALHRDEQAAGLEPGTTLRVAFEPERQVPLLLGRLTRSEWTASIAAGLTALVPAATAASLAETFVQAPAWTDQVVLDLIARVRRVLPVALVTNATVWLDDDLALLGLADVADHIVNSSRVGVAKPDPAIYAIAAERAGVPMQRCLFVDDNLANAEGARAAGMTALHYREAADLQRVLAPLLGGPDGDPDAGPALRPVVTPGTAPG
ncbi:HAD-IA family hydrolase [Actinacidiphila acidipaludis]|uniref:HAD-IA family hydrolase n=1 Tax=Actinacidiphila acidipaludis TaxID=2873382 RepID=A0ABS7QIW9_9ACTN|nr:HAD-IA family hydrolase [Streptomyces acidipaludis]MBY8883121.1 HAD-IA family hydrolase [Streptomyces acidipaludis]